MSSSGHDFPLGTRQRHPTRQADQAPEREVPDMAQDTAETSSMDQQTPSWRDCDIQRAKRVVEETPEVREERVAAAKRALQAGTLKLQGAELADKLLRDPLHHPDCGA